MGCRQSCRKSVIQLWDPILTPTPRETMTISWMSPGTHRHTWFLFSELAQEIQCRPPLVWWEAHWSHIPCLGQGAQFCNSWNPLAADHSSSHWLCSTPPHGPQWAHPHWWSWRWAVSTDRLLQQRQAAAEQWEQVVLQTNQRVTFQVFLYSADEELNTHPWWQSRRY